MNYYDMLGVKENAAPKAIETAHKKLLKRLSSNIADNEKALAVEMMGKLHEAYSVLSGENSRKAYDVSDDIAMSLSELSRYKNIQNKKYRVKINQSGYMSGTVRMPGGCVCCMSADAGKEYTLKKTRRAVFGPLIEYSTSKLQLPLCGECEKHISKANGKYFMVLILPIIFAVALSLIIKSLRHFGDFGINFVLPFSISIVFYIALSLLLRFRKQPLSHTCHNSPARYRTFNRKMLLFEFTNWEFAKRLADANGSTVTEKSARRHANRRSVLTGYDAMDQVIIYPLIGIIFAVLFFGAM